MAAIGRDESPEEASDFDGGLEGGETPEAGADLDGGLEGGETLGNRDVTVTICSLEDAK